MKITSILFAAAVAASLSIGWSEMARAQAADISRC